MLLGSGLAVATASGWSSAPLALPSGSAWLFRDGGELAHASADSGWADWLIDDVVADPVDADQARVAQDDRHTVVVDPGSEQAVSIDAVTLNIDGTTETDSTTVPYTAGGRMYLVSDGLIRLMDPATMREQSRIELPGRVEATIDQDGILWAVTPRDGLLRRVVDGEVDHESEVIGRGHDVQITMAAGRPVVLDRETDELSFVDRRTGEVRRTETLPETADLQGPSSAGSRVWVAFEDSVAAIDPDGDDHIEEIPVEGGPRRPEVVEGTVVVPTYGGQVLVLDEVTGDRRAGGQIDLPAAAEDDFVSFVNDGEVWFNSPSSNSGGVVAQDGEVLHIEVAENGLRQRRDGDVDPDEPLDLAAGAADGDADGQRPNQPPVDPSPPEPSQDPPPEASVPPEEGPPDPVPTLPEPPPTTAAEPEDNGPEQTTTTTSDEDVLPDLVGLSVPAACGEVEDLGLACDPRMSGELSATAEEVVSQDPEPGTAVEGDETVTLTYHEESAVVPELTFGSDACDLVEAAGLTCNLTRERSSDEVAPDQVLSQSPAPGTRVGSGAVVNVVADDHDWEYLYQYANSEADQIELTAGATGPSGWDRTTLGRIFTEEAHGTTGLRCFEPTRETDTHFYSLDGDGTVNPGPYHRRCGITGYVWDDDGAPDFAQAVYEFEGNGRYFSTDPDDPAGSAVLDGAPYPSTELAFHIAP